MNWSSCQQKTTSRLKLFQHIPSLRHCIFNVVSLIKDNKLPFKSFEGFFIHHSHLIGGDNHMEVRIMLRCKFFCREIFSYNFSLLDVSPIRKNFQSWTKSSKLLLPIVKSTTWRNDKEWAPFVLGKGNMTKQSNSLNSFSKTHFIS